MTPNEITTLIASNFDRELDFPFRLQLMERVKYWRDRHITNILEKRPEQRPFFRQTLFMNMENGYINDSMALVGKPLSITVDSIPQLVRGDGILFDYIGGVDGRSPFRKIEPGTANYLETGKFASIFPAYEYNGKVYVDKTDIPRLRIDAIFFDPQQIEEYSCKCLGKSCDTWNTEFPCSGSVVELIVQSILQIDYNRTDKSATPEIQVNTDKQP